MFKLCVIKLNVALNMIIYVIVVCICVLHCVYAWILEFYETFPLMFTCLKCLR